MSTPTGPSRRRRIAGEAKPAVPAPAPPARKPARRPGKPKPAEAAAPPAAPPRPPRVPRPSRRPSEPEHAPAASPAPAAAAATTTREPAGATTDAAPTAGRKDRLRLALLVLLAVLALAFGAFFGVKGVQDFREARGLEASQVRAADAAAVAAETIFGYRFDQLEEHLEDAQATMTPAFAKKFETISPALNDLAPQRRIQVEASTRDAAAIPCGNDCSTNRTTVLVFVDQARLADGATTPTVFGNRIQMTMVERDGRWLVDDVRAL